MLMDKIGILMLGYGLGILTLPIIISIVLIMANWRKRHDRREIKTK